MTPEYQAYYRQWHAEMEKIPCLRFMHELWRAAFTAPADLKQGNAGFFTPPEAELRLNSRLQDKTSSDKGGRTGGS